MYTIGQLTSAFVYRVFIAIPLYYACALIKLLIYILFSIFATFPSTMKQPLKAAKNKAVLPVRIQEFEISSGWFNNNNNELY